MALSNLHIICEAPLGLAEAIDFGPWTLGRKCRKQVCGKFPVCGPR